jgi:hypothetical protein
MHYLTSALDGGERSASCTGRFTPRERAPCIHWIGGWVVFRAVLDVVVYTEIPVLCMVNPFIVKPSATSHVGLTWLFKNTG